MPLQASGSISISQIRTELINVSTSYSLRALSAAASKTSPDAMSEFYGYSSCPPAGTYYSQFCSGYDLYYTYHNGSCGYYNTFIESNSFSCGYTCPTAGVSTGWERICLSYLCNQWGELCSEYATWPNGSAIQLHDGNCGFYYTLQYGVDNFC